MTKPYDDSANLLKAGLGPPIEGRPLPTQDDRAKARELCKAMHPSNADHHPTNWYPSGCNCGTIAQLLADTREVGCDAERVRIATAMVNSAPTRHAFTSGQIDRFGRIAGLSKEMQAAWDNTDHREGLT